MEALVAALMVIEKKTARQTDGPRRWRAWWIIQSYIRSRTNDPDPEDVAAMHVMMDAEQSHGRNVTGQ
jgi:hypothetical protein